MDLVDTHCHLTDPAFEDDLPRVLERARAAGVGRIVTVASDLPDAHRVVELCGRFPLLRGAVGIHPHAAASASVEDLAEVGELAREEGVVAVGEIGLDFHYDHAPRDVQLRLFRRQLDLARDLDLPVVVHSRDADGEMEGILREQGGGVRGVLHCFTGGRALLEQALAVGWRISFTGLVTFRRFDGADLLRAVPRDRLMLETDAPYLAPVPHRGKRNEPAFLPLVARSVAAHRGEDPGEVARYTTEAARAFYRLAE